MRTNSSFRLPVLAYAESKIMSIQGLDANHQRRMADFLADEEEDGAILWQETTPFRPEKAPEGQPIADGRGAAPPEASPATTTESIRADDDVNKRGFSIIPARGSTAAPPRIVSAARSNTMDWQLADDWAAILIFVGSVFTFTNRYSF